MSKPKKPAIAYVRVSTERQGEEGHGLELQLSAIEAFAKHSGYEIVETFRDVYTGMGADSFKNRPIAREAVTLSMNRGWTIIVDGLDRMSRDTATLETIIVEHKLKMISTKGGKGLPRAVMMAEAARGQRQGELISASTKLGICKARERGVTFGNPTNLPEAQALGAAANKDRATARARDLLPVIQELRHAGKNTAGEIAEGLNQKGLQTPRGEPWKATNVRRLLSRVDQLAPVHEAAERSEGYRDNPLWGAF